MRAAMAMALALVTAGCGGPAGPPGGASSGVMTSDELAAFRDAPEKFKEKTLTVLVTVLMPEDRKKPSASLREYAGKPYQFYAMLSSGGIQMTATLPEDASAMPDANSGDVLLTFVCEAGSRTTGNKAISVKRP